MSEIQYLERVIQDPEGVTAQEIADFLGRTVGSVNCQISRVKKQKFPDKKNTPLNGWTKEEITFLKKAYAAYPIIPPAVLSIRSSISVLLPTKSCKISIDREREAAQAVTFQSLFIFREMIGSIKPRGENMSTFPKIFIENSSPAASKYAFIVLNGTRFIIIPLSMR